MISSGPPATPEGNDEVGGKSRAWIGVDLGGTKVSGVVLLPDGTIAHSLRRRHDSTGSSALDVVVDVIRRLQADARPLVVGRVGLAVAGLVKRSSDTLVRGALLELDDINLRELVEPQVGLRVVIENDANATLMGVIHHHPEGHRAPVSDRSVTLLVALGTGIGGAVAIGDRVVQGSGGFAGELGHIPVEAAGLTACPCGSSGCVELFASGTSVARIARGRARPTHFSSNLPLSRLRIESSTHDESFDSAESVVRSALAGDSLAIDVLARAGEALGSALSPLIIALDPDQIIISGGFGHGAAPFLIPALEHRIRRQLPFAAARDLPVVSIDPIGPNAAAIGAAHLARLETPDHPQRSSSH